MPLSVTLVALQLLALVALIWPCNSAGWHWIGALPLALGFVLKGWTLWHNRPGNFSVLPEPRTRATLVTTGPYRYVRHPLYTGLMLFGLGCALGWATATHWLALAVLIVVLEAKARREETFLRARFDGYAAYMARTRRFVPWGRTRGAR